MPYNVFLTSDCNLDCPYCFAKEVLKEFPDEISVSDFKKIITFFHKSGRNEIALLGGEPTRHTRFSEIIDILVAKDFKFTVKSNCLWSSEIDNVLSKVDNDRVSYLLNINPPDFYAPEEYKKILDSISKIRDSRIVLSINIDKPDFKYDYILDIANEFDIKYLRWSFAHPIYGAKEKHEQVYFPIGDYHLIRARVLKIIEECSKSDIQTIGDHSVIRCMFSEEDVRRIGKWGGEINCKCEGTLDILPNLQIIYCLPMYSLFPTVFVNEFSNMDEVDLFFENRIKGLRGKSLPFNKCYSCEFFKSGVCHGGCIAHRQFSEKDLSEAIGNWTYINMKERVFHTSDKIQVLNDGKEMIVNKNNGNEFAINQDIAMLLELFDGESTLEKVINDFALMKKRSTKELIPAIDPFLEECKTFEILELVR